MIKAPFNFVPLSKKVCYLSDDEARISLDIPFNDGLTGVITYRICPKGDTPIFVRNGNNIDKPDSAFSHIFCKNGTLRYFIPATSIKGCIRNVMEIMSFSEMPIGNKLVQNSRYGFRDLNSSDYRNKIQDKNQPVLCGWMEKNGDYVTISNCGRPHRIAVEEIDRALNAGNTLTRFVSVGQKNRSAQYKYEKLLAQYKDRLGCSLGFSKDTKKYGFVYLKYNNNSKECTGRIVLTGQPNTRKKHEFVFPDKTDSVLTVSRSVFADFETIHSSSSDYVEWRKKQLYKGKAIPVFFQVNEKGEVSSIGLSYMYKYPYKHSVFDGVPQYAANTLDVTNAVFGYVDGKDSLRGRVQFSSAFLAEDANCVVLSGYDKVVLSSPRSSYYPLYVENGKSWDKDGLRLAGWKRYPVGINNFVGLRNSQGSQGMESSMTPIVVKEGYFHGTVHFFNLRPFELGTLLSALTFHGKENCSHTIGMGKAYGFGVVRLNIDDIKYAEWQKGDGEWKNYLTAYSEFMNGRLGENWLATDSVKELFAMAEGIPENKREAFRYMQMKNSAGKNDFVEAKKKKEHLPRFTEIVINDSKPNGAQPAGQVPSWVRYAPNYQWCRLRNNQLELKGGANGIYIVKNYQLRSKGTIKDPANFKARLELKGGVVYVDVLREFMV